MNRQARLAGEDEWMSFGPVTFAEAAQLRIVAGYTSLELAERKHGWNVELRDEHALHEPVRSVRVHECISFKVSGLRDVNE